MSDPGLFDAEPFRQALPPPVPKLSAGRRLKLRQEQAIRLGWHPLSHVTADGLRLAPEGTGTCGDCRFRRPSAGDHTYPKCLYGAYETEETGYEGRPFVRTHYPRVSASLQTDCRAWWPACVDFEPKETSA